MNMHFYYNGKPINETSGIVDPLHLNQIRDAVLEQFETELNKNYNPDAWIKVDLENEPKNSMNLLFSWNIINSKY